MENMLNQRSRLRKVGRRSCGLVFGIVLGLVGFSGEQHNLQNGAFFNGLSHWTVDGDVSDFSGSALFRDLGADVSVMYQAIRFDEDHDLRVDLQLLPLLSANRPAGTLLDTLSASLYFTDDAGAFDFSSSSFNAATKLFDLDSGGPYNVIGSFEDSDFREGWLAYTATVPASTGYVILAMELYNLNGVEGDSRLFADWLNLCLPEHVGSALHLRVEADEVIQQFSPIQGFSNRVEFTETLEDEGSWRPSPLPPTDIETYREPVGPCRRFYRIRYFPSPILEGRP